ncbi:MAG TPA: hypothetical protein VKB80_00590 [Kofleriaceae bacterium]|nr:hypothetical protein [Kofleriaceae bacterium]
MSGASVEGLRARLVDVERAIDGGTYRPGPWAAIVRQAGALPREERLALEADVSRVSDKLHRRNHPGRKVGVRLGVVLELIGTADGLVGLYLGLRWDFALLVAVSTFVMCATLQPLVKMMVGRLLGVRYSYFYLHFILEPRVKMRYGTYLALSTTGRVIVHFAGMIGSPGAFLVVAPFIAGRMPITASICTGIGWGFVGLNLMFFVLAFAGVRRVEQLFSGGAAAREIRNSFRARTA